MFSSLEPFLNLSFKQTAAMYEQQLPYNETISAEEGEAVTHFLAWGKHHEQLLDTKTLLNWYQFLVIGHIDTIPLDATPLDNFTSLLNARRNMRGNPTYRSQLSGFFPPVVSDIVQAYSENQSISLEQLYAVIERPNLGMTLRHAAFKVLFERLSDSPDEFNESRLMKLVSQVQPSIERLKICAGQILVKIRSEENQGLKLACWEKYQPLLKALGKIETDYLLPALLKKAGGEFAGKYMSLGPSFNTLPNLAAFHAFNLDGHRSRQNESIIPSVYQIFPENSADSVETLEALFIHTINQYFFREIFTYFLNKKEPDDATRLIKLVKRRMEINGSSLMVMPHGGPPVLEAVNLLSRNTLIIDHIRAQDDDIADILPEDCSGISSDTQNTLLLIAAQYDRAAFDTLSTHFGGNKVDYFLKYRFNDVPLNESDYVSFLKTLKPDVNFITSLIEYAVKTRNIPLLNALYPYAHFSINLNTFPLESALSFIKANGKNPRLEVSYLARNLAENKIDALSQKPMPNTALFLAKLYSYLGRGNCTASNQSLAKFAEQGNHEACSILLANNKFDGKILVDEFKIALQKMDGALAALLYEQMDSHRRNAFTSSIPMVLSFWRECPPFKNTFDVSPILFNALCILDPNKPLSSYEDQTWFTTFLAMQLFYNGEAFYQSTLPENLKSHFQTLLGTVFQQKMLSKWAGKISDNPIDVYQTYENNFIKLVDYLFKGETSGVLLKHLSDQLKSDVICLPLCKHLLKLLCLCNKEYLPKACEEIDKAIAGKRHLRLLNHYLGDVKALLTMRRTVEIKDLRSIVWSIFHGHKPKAGMEALWVDLPDEPNVAAFKAQMLREHDIWEGKKEATIQDITDWDLAEPSSQMAPFMKIGKAMSVCLTLPIPSDFVKPIVAIASTLLKHIVANKPLSTDLIRDLVALAKSIKDDRLAKSCPHYALTMLKSVEIEIDKLMKPGSVMSNPVLVALRGHSLLRDTTRSASSDSQAMAFKTCSSGPHS